MKPTTAAMATLAVVPGPTHPPPDGPGPEPAATGEPAVAVRADFDLVYAAKWPEMVRIARLLTGSRTAGEEVAQDAFVGLMRHFDQVQNPAAYLRASVANGARSAYRRRREHEPLDAAYDRAVEPPGIDETWLALDALTSRQRVVVVLRFYEDLPLNQIADALGWRLGTVKSTLSRAMTVLRKELS